MVACRLFYILLLMVSGSDWDLRSPHLNHTFVVCMAINEDSRKQGVSEQLLHIC